MEWVWYSVLGWLQPGLAWLKEFPFLTKDERYCWLLKGRD